MTNRNILTIAGLALLVAGSLAAQPVPNAPPNGATDQPIDVTLSWRPLSTASAYEVHLSMTDDFTEYEEATVGESTAGFTNLLFQKSYHWRVRGLDPLGNPTPWSAVNTFTTRPSTGIPQLLLPADGTTDMEGAVKLEWTAIAGAGDYEVEWAENGEFRPSERAQTTMPEKLLTGLKQGTQYFWRARLVGAAAPGVWSRWFTFTTAWPAPAPLPTPVLISPADGAASLPGDVALIWSGTAAMKVRYDVEVARTNDFTELVAAAADLDSTAFDAVNLTPGETYFWRVRSSGDESRSEWTKEFSFSTAPPKPSGPVAPQLLLPANGATYIPETVMLSWDSIPDATGYTLQLSHDPEFALLTGGGRTTTASYEISGLTLDSTYHWRVRAENGVGESAWSRPFSFSTKTAQAETPSKPLLISPADASGDATLPTELVWERAKNATSYIVEISPDESFGEESTRLAALEPTAVAADLEKGTTYRWRVRALNESGPSAWSDVWSFTTEAGTSDVETEAPAAPPAAKI